MPRQTLDYDEYGYFHDSVRKQQIPHRQEDDFDDDVEIDMVDEYDVCMDSDDRFEMQLTKTKSLIIPPVL